MGVVDYLIAEKSRQFDLTSRSGKSEFLESVLPAIAKLRDEASQSAYVVKLATHYRYNEQALLEQVKTLKSGQKIRRVEYREKTPEAPSEDQASQPKPVLRSKSRSSLHAEERLLTLMLKKPEWNELVYENLTSQDLARSELRPFLEVLLQFRSIERPLTWTDLDVQDQATEAVWARLMAADAPDSTQADMERLISDIKRNGLEPRYELIRQQVLDGMSQGTVGPDSELYREYRYLQKRLKGTRNE